MKVVFIDRDGVINKDRRDYIKSWSEFCPIPGSIEALRLLRLHDYSIIVITNQSAINRKMIDRAELQEIHDNMVTMVKAQGGDIEAIYSCPHRPEENCACRKPKPGLIYRAQADYGLELSEICMIGDSLKDIECARRAGCGEAVLVRTGHGIEAERLCEEKGIVPNYVADDLMAAAKWLLQLDES